MDTKLTFAVADTIGSIHKEHQYRKLESLGFVRGMTAMDQWFLLVNEAWHKTKLPLNERLRDYLVVMLNHHMTNSALLERLSAFRYLEHLLGLQKVDGPSTQEVADMCLQCVSFFPERATARHEMKSYDHVVEIGVSLYRELAKRSEGKDDWYSLTFRSIADSFGKAVVVLRSACPAVIGSAVRSGGLWRKGEVMLTDVEAQRIAQVMDQLGRLTFVQNDVFSSSTVPQ
jgi:hypothetical protein